jgi:hypothetical protein
VFVVILFQVVLVGSCCFAWSTPVVCFVGLLLLGCLAVGGKVQLSVVGG